MKINIEHFDGKYPSFNVGLSSAEGKEPFVVIKGCRLADGRNGQFVSWPAQKKDDGKYWNHVYASEAFAKAVLEEALKTMPSKRPAARDVDSDIPF